MKFYSEVKDGKEYIYTDKKGERLLVAITIDDVLIKCHSHLTFNYYVNYYLSKGWENGKLEKLADKTTSFKAYREIINLESELLKVHPELKYQDLSCQLKNTYYEEEKHRLRFLKEIEFLQKYEGGRYGGLVAFASVLKLNKEQFKKLTTCINNAGYNLKTKINFAKSKCKTLKEYAEQLETTYILKKIKVFEKDREKAKTFYKRLEKWGFIQHRYYLNLAIDLYNDTCAMANRFIGFPKDLRETHDRYVERQRKKQDRELDKKLKNARKQRRHAKLELPLKKYGASVLVTKKEYEDIGNLFDNCMATYYSKENVICGVIYKECEPYACVSVKISDKQIEQLYLRHNESLEKKEYNKIKRSLVLTV